MEHAPPLTWWSHTWRLLVSLLISGLAWLQYAPEQLHHHELLFWVDAALGSASYALVLVRRRWPLSVALATNALTLLSVSASGPAALALVSLATRRVYWQIAATAVVGVSVGMAFIAIEPKVDQSSWWVELSVATTFTVATAAIGLYVGSRRELIWSLRERARQAEEQQELRMDSARAAERERIAREMHDVLAHRISMVSMHAGALAYRTDLPPDQVRETAALIQSTAHEALTDLRVVLGVLRDDDPALRDRPQPTLRDLPDLVGEARAAGMRVDFDVDVGPTDAFPDAIGRTVYRIVQEGLTNARKHALGAAVSVEVAVTPDPAVEVWVRNDVRPSAAATTPGSGLGLVGLKERAELAGGRLDVRADGRTFALHGWLPWPA